MKSKINTKHARGRRSAPRWQLQTAKAQFSEVVRRARVEGPQYVTRQGKDAVVILPAEEFERLTARARQPESLVKFFAESPLAGAGLDLKRKPDYGRDIEL
jgi:antitoxin Phd